MSIIHVLAVEGSPLKVTCKSLWGEDGRIGVGGAELSLLTMCEEWTKRGHEVVLFNNPKELHASPFEQRAVGNFSPYDKRDILIIFRSPTDKVNEATGRKFWWSHDQQTSGNFAEFSKCVDQVVCVSQFHVDYFKMRYGINNAVIIENPVRTQDYAGKKLERIPNRFLFASVPDRGLKILLDIWPEIKTAFQDASLVITSDYRLWGSVYPLNEKYREQAMGLQGIKFKGGIKRAQLIEEQLISDVLAYPCIYDELMCISVAEAEVSGAFPITSTVGALGTTNMGLKLEGDPKTKVWQREFLGMIYDFLKNPNKEWYRDQVMKTARARFNPETIANRWDEVFNK